jgi:hypothetical protein
LLDAGREAAQHAVGAQASGCRVRNLVWAREVKKHGIGGTTQRRWESSSFRVADEYSDDVIQLVLSEIIPNVGTQRRVSCRVPRAARCPSIHTAQLVLALHGTQT